MSCPWAKIQPVATGVMSIDDITAEEVVKSMQEKEFQKYARNVETEVPEEYIPCDLDGTDDDVVIAQLLQNEFNHEYDSMLKRTEEKFNGGSKVGISLSNYRVCSDVDHEEKININDENRDLDRFVSIEKEYASIPRCGYKKSSEGTEIVTKHDILLSSRINACRVLEFPPGISTGDTGGFDVKLNNKVFNSLRAHSHAFCAREKAKARPHNK
ncbi:hypothetical protein PV325_005718 [Microctonus aethiopoides]|uniref:Serine/threonine-protein kinase RIO3 n=1 Tax=Microctonus aethiopoides TaxID=144406 RepID=A0AA39FB93_9HYME|nr:hypothetical protein PV325_005718 [Microctonus aethiopoides]KAK0097237.1 hypothetical protein PV326_002820 [Microctonus aethiopoides]KAK0166219.1 hypothetical protein PV328_004660 [Microctonus aethiopoides]